VVENADHIGTAKVVARDDYLEDINHFLLNNITLNYMSVMGYRRKSHAWAVAHAIKEYEGCKEQTAH
jgi:hypothetical protein